MPTFSIESPQTGQTYRVQFEREPSPADLDFAAQQFDKEWWQQQGIEPGSAITQQTPLGTFTNAVANVGPTLAGMVGGGMRYLDKAAEVVAQATGTERGGLFGDIAQQAEAIQTEGDVLRPLNPANPTARTLGQGAAQGLGMLGTAAASVPALGARGLMAVPAALGFGAGAGEGVQQAEAMGLSPVGQLAQGTAFGAAEAATEALGGIGGAVLRPARTLAGRALGGLASETLEEPAAGMLQEAITNVAALPVRDPARPGYTRTGFPIPGPEGYLDRRAQEALGGAAGGLVFAGAQAAAAYGRPGADNSQASVTDRTERAAADKTGEQVIGAGSTPAAGSFSTADAGLGGIAARAGSVEVESLLPSDGYAAEEQLTAADVQDLETGGQGNGEMGSNPPVTSRQPILTNVPDAAPNVSPQGVGQTVSDTGGDISASPGAVSPAPTAVSEMDILPVNPAIQDQPQTITGSNEQTGSEMPVPPPTAEAGAGAGVEAVPKRQKSLYEVRAAQGDKITDDQDQDTRWRMNVFGDAVELVSESADQRMVFPIADRKSYADKLRALMRAQLWAVENRLAPQSAETAIMQANYGGGRVETVTPTSTAAPSTPATTPAPVAAAMPSPATVGGQVGSETGALLDVAPSTRPRNRGETAKPQRAEVLGELTQAVREGAANQAQTRLPLNPTANMPSPGEAGFVNADMLGELARAAIQAGKDFATWAREMVARFGEAIRSQLAAIWQQATAQVRGAEVRFGGTVTPMAPAAERGFVSLQAALGLHRRGEPFRVRNVARRALLTGSPLPRDLTQVLDATEAQRKAVEQAAAQVAQDLQAAMTAAARRPGLSAQAVNQVVQDVMEGVPGALVLARRMDAALGERARRARNLLDDLSLGVAQTLPAGNLRDIITGNLGQWMRRSYAAFDPESGWNYDAVMQAAAERRQIGGRDAAVIVQRAKAFLQAQNPAAAAQQIEADMRDLMDRDQWVAGLTDGRTVRKSVSSFMQRKNIPEELRALMGEETNPVHRLVQSARFQSQVIARHAGQVAMRNVGLAAGLFAAQRGGVYTQQVVEDGQRWSGLAGVWTTPQLWRALNETTTTDPAGRDLGGVLVETLKALGNEAKLNRVALNPDSWIVNILGNWVGMVQAGDVFALDFVRRIKQAAQLLRAGKAKPAAVMNAAEEALVDARRAMLARLRGLDVIGSSVNLADIEASIPRHLLQWVAEDQARNRGLGAVKGAIMGQGAGRALGLPGRVAGGVLGAAAGAAAGAQRLQSWQQTVAKYLMTGPDALARVTGWLTNYETALAAGIVPDVAAKWAATRTLNTFPNYNALPDVLRQMSRIGIIGSFIAFQYEVYRNFGWNVAYAVQELRSRNAALQSRGLRRLAGVASVAALAAGGLASMLARTGAAGDDDERNRKFRRWFAAPWERDAVLAFDEFTPERVGYFNTSYLLPQVTIMELAQAAADGKDPEESAARVVSRLTEQFINGSVHLQPIMQALMNQDRVGRKITNKPGLAGALERADTVLETVGEPGLTAKINRLIYAINGAQRRGRVFSVEEEAKRLFGVRRVTRTWADLVNMRYSRFNSEYMAARDEANRILAENQPGAAAAAVEYANARARQLQQDLEEYERDLQLLGIDPQVVRLAKRESSLTRLRPVRVRADGKRVEMDPAGWRD